MRHLLRRLSTAFAVLSVLAVPALAVPMDDRSADEILAEIEATPEPEPDYDREDEPGYYEQFRENRKDVLGQRAELIGELLRVDPGNPKLPRLITERWETLTWHFEQEEIVDEEIDSLLADESHPIRTTAAYFRPYLMVSSQRKKGEEQKVLDSIEAFIAIAPQEKNRAASLLFNAADYSLFSLPRKQKKALLQRVLDEYPDSSFVEKAQGTLQRIEGVGHPFELTFQDVMTGKTISVQDDLKGKVVVIDFWATWCGPCIGDLPEMKEIYREYKDKGVEFIGVSLDDPEEEGGLRDLKAFLAEHEVPWPQYYPGNGWESAFPRSWGINAVPTYFVIDPQGVLQVTQTAPVLLRAVLFGMLKAEEAASDD